MESKKTPLYDKHLKSGAKIVDFSGWALPLEYESVLKEAKATRQTCGLFDASHMGEIKIEGQDAFDFLQKLTPNDISLIQKGQLQYNLLLNARGGIIDDFMLYNLGDAFLCVVNASNTYKDCAWLLANKDQLTKENRAYDLNIKDESLSTALLSLQGPKAALIAEQIFGKHIHSLGYMHFIEQQISGQNFIVSRSGYTGEDGFELCCPWSSAQFLWDELLNKGRSCDLCLCGLGARDILRIEAGYPLYGHEINDNTNPIEASLEWVVKFTKDFIAKEYMVNSKRNSVSRRRVGFVMQERAMARQGYQIFSSDKLIGEVTSGTYSPNLDKFIGMAYAAGNSSNPDSHVEIKIRDKFYKAKITGFAFIRNRTNKAQTDQKA